MAIDNKKINEYNPSEMSFFIRMQQADFSTEDFKKWIIKCLLEEDKETIRGVLDSWLDYIEYETAKGRAGGFVVFLEDIMNEVQNNEN